MKYIVAELMSIASSINDHDEGEDGFSMQIEKLADNLAAEHSNIPAGLNLNNHPCVDGYAVTEAGTVI